MGPNAPQQQQQHQMNPPGFIHGMHPMQMQMLQQQQQQLQQQQHQHMQHKLPKRKRDDGNDDTGSEGEGGELHPGIYGNAPPQRMAAIQTFLAGLSDPHELEAAQKVRGAARVWCVVISVPMMSLMFDCLFLLSSL
jgi:hypothetical protein